MSNMMILLNGTPGQSDGIEITGNIILKNVLDGYSIMSPNQSGGIYNRNRNCIIVPICIRMKPGFKASGIKITYLVNASFYSSPVALDNSGTHLPTLFTSYPSSDYSNPDYLDLNNASENFNNSSITDNVNHMFLLVICLRGDQTSIPGNTTLFQISYQEDKA